MTADQGPSRGATVRTATVPPTKPRAPRPRIDLWLGLLLALAAGLLYAATAARDIAWGDSAEFTLAATELGVPHPTGYPTYLLATRLAAALPGGSLPWRVNAFSGLCAALAVSCCFALGRRLGLGRAAAIMAALSLGCSREVWLQSTTAEVYTLHLLIVGLALWAAAVWHQERDARLIAVAALAFGFGLSHHLTIVLTAPALAWLLWAGPRRLPPLRAILWGLIPVSLYLVLLLRSLADPSLDQGDPESLAGLVTHLSGRQFSYRLFTSTSGYVQGEFVRIGALLARQLWPAFLVPAGLGVIWLARRRRTEAIALALVALIVTVYVASYNIPDKDGYLLPVVLVLALAIGAGAEQLFSWWSKLGQRWHRTRALGALPRRAPLLLLLAPLVTLPLHRAAADRHADRSLADLTREAYGRATPGSLILTDDTNSYFTLLYLQQQEDLLTDRQAMLTYLIPLPWYLPSLAERLPGLVTPEIRAEVEGRYRSSASLSGAVMGRQRAADQQTLAALIARQALPGRPVFLYRHKFEESLPTWEGLTLVDRGLIYEVRATSSTAPPDTTRLDFRRAEHYTTERLVLHGERGVAKRYATAANREGIRRVQLGDTQGAERAFLQAKTHDPDYAQAWLNLGLLYADYLDRPAEARVIWERYLELAADDAEATRVRRRLRALPPAP